MISLRKRNYLREIGILRFKNRELLNISYISDWDIAPQFGMDISMCREVPIHIGMTLYKFNFYIQVLGIQFGDHILVEE